MPPVRPLVLGLEEVEAAHRSLVGGKAVVAADLLKAGYSVPNGFCVTTAAYDAYIDATGLRERILMELNRKDFGQMRWEEMWDAALRIRNMFLGTSIPPALRKRLARAMRRWMSDAAVAVRSSAPQEDAAGSSFAGLHESFLNVVGERAVLDHVRRVWASLWSDAALLYRRELGLSVETSSMGVLVHALVNGSCSGVAFSTKPDDPSHAVIEAVYGLNQGLVDGTVSPDRWIVDRGSGRIVAHEPAERTESIVAGRGGVRLRRLPAAKAERSPLSKPDVIEIHKLAIELEERFGTPQDVEWTMKGTATFVLQSRAITGVKGEGDAENKGWYLSLRRSFENLKALRQRVEQELIPAIDREGRLLAEQDLEQLSDAKLLTEVQRRQDMHGKWLDVYWSDFIPLAHGTRLFGEFYNDTVRPSDPYEFLALLATEETISARRNGMLEQAAWRIRKDAGLFNALGSRSHKARTRLDRMLEELLESFAEGPLRTLKPGEAKEAIERLLLGMVNHPSLQSLGSRGGRADLENSFLARFEGAERTRAREMLDIARASYRLRDDDNVYLGRIAHERDRALQEAQRRGLPVPDSSVDGDALRPTDRGQASPAASPSDEGAAVRGFEVRPRQLLGQPASPGLAAGLARTIEETSDLFEFQAGEVLVCDAMDPGMSFVLPLAAAVVERRGGMLIHGATVAREYGIPCVTGVPNAVSAIPTGMLAKVDGYLGIVTVESP